MHQRDAWRSPGRGHDHRRVAGGIRQRTCPGPVRTEGTRLRLAGPGTGRARPSPRAKIAMISICCRGEPGLGCAAAAIRTLGSATGVGVLAACWAKDIYSIMLAWRIENAAAFERMNARG